MRDEEGNFRIPLRPEGARPPERGPEFNEPRYTPGPTVRRQHRTLACCLGRISRMLFRMVDAVEPELRKAVPFKEMDEMAHEARITLANTVQTEGRHMREALETEGPGINYRGGLTEWLIPHGSEPRPATDDPFAMVLMDYVDNLRNDAEAFIKAAIALGAQHVPNRNDASRWKIYERLSSLFRHVDALAGCVESARGLAVEWNLKVPGLVNWIDTSAKFLRFQNEQVRTAMVQARGPLLP